MKTKVIIVLAVVGLNWSCYNCDDCVNNLEYFYNKYKNSNQHLISYIDLNGLEIKDTVLITYRSVPKEFCTNGKEVENINL